MRKGGGGKKACDIRGERKTELKEKKKGGESIESLGPWGGGG